MSKHYQPKFGETSEEVTTEDGKHKYWRLAVPLPLFARQMFWPRKVYICQCAKSFPSQAAYELHYRKAYDEEKHMAGATPLVPRPPTYNVAGNSEMLGEV